MRSNRAEKTCRITGAVAALLTGLLLLPALVLSQPLPAAADVLFIAPAINVPVRRGKNERYKIIRTAKIGEKVELLRERDDWSKVRFADGVEGWLPKHLLTPDIPAAQQAEQLLNENELLKARNETLSVELSALQEYQHAESEKLETCIAERNLAKAERRALEDTARVTWFLAGSGVLLMGWLLGRLSGRPSRRRSTLRL